MKILGVVGVIVAFIAAPYIVSSFHVFQLTQLVVYAIALLGLNLLTGWSGQISLGHGAFYAIGAYTTAILLDKEIMPWWATIPVAGLITYLIGYVFGKPAVRLEGLYLALATFALGIVMPQILKLDALEKWTGGSQGVTVNKPDSPFPDLIDVDQWFYFICLAIGIALYFAAWNLVRGRSGRALVALRDHPIAAAAMGVDVASYKARTFGVSAMYTGIAGALGALLAGFVSPDSFQIFLSINFLVGIVVGGIASVFGNLFGAAFIDLVPNVAEKISDAAPWALYGALLIGFMMVLPNGAAGLVRSVGRLVRRGRARS